MIASFNDSKIRRPRIKKINANLWVCFVGSMERFGIDPQQAYKNYIQSKDMLDKILGEKWDDRN
jgi:hypothetical protein